MQWIFVEGMEKKLPSNAGGSLPHPCTLYPLRSKRFCFLSRTHAVLCYTNLPSKPRPSPTCFLKTLLTVPDPLSISDDFSLTSYHIYIPHKTNDFLMRSVLLCSLVASCIKNLFSPARYGPLWRHKINFSCIFQCLYNTEYTDSSY